MQVLENIAKRNIVAMAILTQAEAQKELALQEQENAVKTDSIKEQQLPTTGKHEGSAAITQAPEWRIEWDFSLHKFFPIVKLAK